MRLIPFLVDFMPLAVFFIANNLYGLVTASGLLVITTAIAFAYAWRSARRFPYFAAWTLFFVAILGGATVILGDTLFIKVQPTITNLLFGLVLLVGLLFERTMMERFFGHSFDLTPKAWRLLSLRWALFCLAMALANEVAWRGLSEDNWVLFKVFVVAPFTCGFALLQLPLCRRERLSAASG